MKTFIIKYEAEYSLLRTGFVEIEAKSLSEAKEIFKKDPENYVQWECETDSDIALEDIRFVEIEE